MKLTWGAPGVPETAASLEGKGFLKISPNGIYETEDLSVEFRFKTSQSLDRNYWPVSASLSSSPMDPTYGEVHHLVWTCGSNCNNRLFVNDILRGE